MRIIKSIVKRLPGVQSFVRRRAVYDIGKALIDDPLYKAGQARILAEEAKSPTRTEVINFLLARRTEPTRYLEIGVRNPADNFDKIDADEKHSVDPGVDYMENPVEFPMTSDEFFERLRTGSVLSPDVRFDLVFIDGLHLADQVDRDITHAFEFLKADGFVVLHDCNPMTEWHARETYRYPHTPAGMYWAGTTWKAFLKWRCEPSVQSCCIDTDWGVGILCKESRIGEPMTPANPFFEFHDFDAHREEYLNLLTFEEFQRSLP